MKKLNVKLLNRIKKHIIAEPKRYNQNIWGRQVIGEDAPACGTQGCIAGWAVFLSFPKSRWHEFIHKFAPSRAREVYEISRRARILLGLTRKEADSLFEWVGDGLGTGKLGVQNACKKIDALIESRKP